MANGGIDGWNNPAVTLPAGAGRADSALRRLEIAGKPFYVLRQRGRLADLAYDHGRLLAREIEAGVFPEILATIARGTDLGGPLHNGVATTLFRALSDRIAASTSREFRDAMDGMAAGYRDALPAPRFSRQQVIDATVGIEVENIVDGIARRLQVPSLAVRAETVREVAELCVSDRLESETRDIFGRAAEDESAHGVLRDTLAHMAHPDHRTGFACTGFSVPGGMTRDGRHLHARNLDADLYNWNNASVLFLVDESPGGSGRHKYVAFGTAGLLYPGGISGINDAGIATSLHQLSTTRYRIDYDAGGADLAPFVQQRILRDAATLEEAVAIAEANGRFAAWVIFCSDAKTGQSVHIEFNGRDVRVGPVVTTPFTQTNHFVHPDLVEHLFNADDAHFTPTLAKWLETRTRLAMVQQKLDEAAAKAAVDLDWAIDLLASGRDVQLVEVARGLGLDPATVGVERSFGRVPRKAYGQLGSVVRGDPARRAGCDEAWMTTGDRLPACDSVIVGWRIDWDGFDVQPVDGDPLRRTTQYSASGRRDWENSLGRYLMARVATARPKSADGALLARAPTDTERQEGCRQAEALLSEAIALATADRIVEVPYHFMRARMRHQLAEYAEANADWDLLRAIRAGQSGQMSPAAEWPVPNPRWRPILHDYEAALALTLAVVTQDRLRGNTAWPGRAQELQAARELFQGLRTRLFGDRPAHFDLLAWIDRVDAIDKKGSSDVTLPVPNFVSVE